MGWMRVLLVVAVLVSLASYWLYAPLPPGYSSHLRSTFQTVMAFMKWAEVISYAGSFLGFGSQPEILRSIVQKAMKHVERPHTPEVHIRDTVFDGIPVTLYEPSNTLNETLPGMVYYHGGGWVFGSPDTVDSFVRLLCQETRTVIVSVDYRLAPENRFPAAFEDCVAATKYFLTKAAEFNVDPTRVAVIGDSAGGNLAATVSLKLRDDQFPIRPRLQVLIYPVVQGLDFQLPSMVQNKDGPLLTRSLMAYFTAAYILGSTDLQNIFEENRHVTRSFREQIANTYMNIDQLPTDYMFGYTRPEYPEGDVELWNEIKDRMLDPYYCPLAADNLENLPKTFVLTAQYDVLRDEAWLYANRLKDAKNDVTLIDVDGGFHGMIHMIGSFPELDPVLEKMTDFVNTNL